MGRELGIQSDPKGYLSKFPVLTGLTIRRYAQKLRLFVGLQLPHFTSMSESSSFLFALIFAQRKPNKWGRQRIWQNTFQSAKP